jgi:hypothetical protein
LLLAWNSGKTFRAIVINANRQNRILASQTDIETSHRKAEERTRIVPEQVIMVGIVLQSLLLRNMMTQMGDSSTITSFPHYGDSVLGIYFSNIVDKHEFANGILEDFISHVQQFSIGQTL